MENRPIDAEDMAALLEGRHDGANGWDARGKNHSKAYWVGYREGLIAKGYTGLLKNIEVAAIK